MYSELAGMNTTSPPGATSIDGRVVAGMLGLLAIEKKARLPRERSLLHRAGLKPKKPKKHLRSGQRKTDL